MPPRIQVLLLTQKAEVKETNLNTAPDGTINLAMLQALLKKKEAPELIGSYKNKGQGLFLFGYTTGKAGTENKHELPPPHDSILCFGDLILLASKDPESWKTPVPFKMDEYEAFYTRAFGGFEDLDSEEELEEAEEELAEDLGEDLEDDLEDAEAEVEAEPEPEAEEVPVKVTKKARKAAQTVAVSAAQVYSTFLHVPASEELVEEADVRGDLPPVRTSVHKTITKLFGDYLKPEECSQFERCIYNGALRTATQRHVGKSWTHPPFVEVYTQYAKHLASNFHPESYVGNNELYAHYKSGEITFDDISKMDTYQLFEKRWVDSFNQQQIREKRQLEGNKAMATDRFLCTKCFKRECTYYEMQTRSADEPMTIFITCLNCGKHWRQ
jgi:DNA-directed RNA polymerase subunit M/transcription elongation factor TFIIS